MRSQCSDYSKPTISCQIKSTLKLVKIGLSLTLNFRKSSLNSVKTAWKEEKIVVFCHFFPNWGWACSYDVLNFWTNFSLNVLINWVLIKKTCICLVRAGSGQKFMRIHKCEKNQQIKQASTYIRIFEPIFRMSFYSKMCHSNVPFLCKGFHNI